MRQPAVIDGYPTSSVVPGEWERAVGGGGPLDLMTGAGVLGARIWLEREMHRLVGAWALTADHPGLAVAFDRVAMRHAERANVLFDRLPHLRELPAASVVVAGGPATTKVVDAIEAADRDGVGSAVGSWLAVAEGLSDSYSDHLGRCSVVADSPLLRRLPALVAGLESDMADVSATAVRAGGREFRPAPDPEVVAMVRLTDGFLN